MMSICLNIFQHWYIRIGLSLFIVNYPYLYIYCIYILYIASLFRILSASPANQVNKRQKRQNKHPESHQVLKIKLHSQYLPYYVKWNRWRWKESNPAPDGALAKIRSLWKGKIYFNCLFTSTFRIWIFQPVPFFPWPQPCLWRDLLYFSASIDGWFWYSLSFVITIDFVWLKFTSLHCHFLLHHGVRAGRPFESTVLSAVLSHLLFHQYLPIWTVSAVFRRYRRCLPAILSPFRSSLLFQSGLLFLRLSPTPRQLDPPDTVFAAHQPCPYINRLIC